MNNTQFKITRKNNYFEIIDDVKNIYILTKAYSFGKNIVWTQNIKICNANSKPMENLIVGDNVYLGHDSTIMVSAFSVLDYTKINNHFYAYGDNPVEIGYNCWFGSLVILDSLGGLKLENNVGIGSQSQIYSHAKFGDVLYGCRINSYTPVSIADDVWIAPNSVITSASMAPRSMLLAGSTLTKSTQENHIYSGVPAQDVTKKLGEQFNMNLNYKEIFDRLNQYLHDFYTANPQFKEIDSIKIEYEKPKEIDIQYSYFIVKDRMYTKIGTAPEIAFIQFLLPDKAKFIPYQDKK